MSGLKYAMIMLTIRDSPRFRECLSSIVDSDYDQSITVSEDGYYPEPACQEYASSLGVEYVKHDRWLVGVPMINEFVRNATDVDVIIYTHSDVSYPESWFTVLNAAWEDYRLTGRIGLINLSMDNIEYLWDGKEIRDTDVIVDGRHHVFYGMSTEEQLVGIPGRMAISSAAFSFSTAVFNRMGGFDSNILCAPDSELLIYSIAHRMLNMWANNPAVTHTLMNDSLRGGDKKLAKGLGGKFFKTNIAFAEKYGCDPTYLATPYIKFMEEHRDEINLMIREDRFDDIDELYLQLVENLPEALREVICRM